jgi:outer membrane protein assembly factor BamE (lipoprotein component of BamABCDE complex)
MQQRSVGLILAVNLCASLAACGSLGDLGAYKSGTQVSDVQMAQIIDHRTTSAEVAKLLGQPEEKAQVGGKEIWRYKYTQIGQAIVGENKSETTTVEFDATGIVIAHYKSSGVADKTGNALLDAAHK